MKKDLKHAQKSKESLEQWNYELITQVKDVNERLNFDESRITCMNTGKAKLDKMLQTGRPVGLQTGLQYVGEKQNTRNIKKNAHEKHNNNVVGMVKNLKGVFRRQTLIMLRRGS